MLTERQYLDKYAESHRNHTNQIVHMICVPVIYWATLSLFWLIPVGRWLGLAPEMAYWVNGATVFGVLSLAFYGRLSGQALVIGAGWLLVSLVLAAGIEKLVGPMGLGITAVVVWVAAWIGQFIGHQVEGKKPSFLDDLLFLLIGPLFVQHKMNHLVAKGHLPAH